GQSWATVAVPVGVLSGLAGAAWRGGGWQATVAIGLFGGALLGEALLILPDMWRPGSWEEAQYLVTPLAEMTAAFALPTALLERREALRAMAITGVTGPVALAFQERILELVRESLR